MQVKFGTKIPGVTAKQLFAYQLKAIKPKLKPLWKAFSGRAIGQEADWTCTFTELYDTINSLVSLFHDASAVVQGKRNRDSETEFQKLISVLRAEEDTCLDILKCIGIYYYIESIEHRAKQSLSADLSNTLNLMIESLFKSGAPSDKPTASGDGMHLENDEPSNEDEEDTVPISSRAVNNDQYVTEVISVAAELLKTVHGTVNTNSDALSESALNPLLSFTNSFLEGTLQNVLVLFANRKKLYTLVCSQLVPSALSLFSCHSSMEGVSELLNTLRSTVSESLEMGLLDDKHVDDLATIHLPGSEEVAAALPVNNNNKNKKQKSGGNSTAATVAAGDGAPAAAATTTKVVKYNPSFLESLFQRLSEYYYGSTDSTVAVSTLELSRRADNISQLLVIYASKSRAKAVAAKQQSDPKSAALSAEDPSVVSLDVNSLRKHLQRVMHFSFLLVEFLKRKPQPGTAATATAGAESGKRKADAVDSPTNDSDLSGSDLMAYKVVRNRILRSLCSLLEGQAIPNHDSLAVYQTRLMLLARQSCSGVQRAQEEVWQLINSTGLKSDDVSTSSVAEEVSQKYQSMALEVDCYRLVATMDQTITVMEDLTSSVQLLLSDVSLVFGDASTAAAVAAGTRTTAKKKKTSSVVDKTDQISAGFVSWHWHLNQHFSLTPDSLYQKLIDRSAQNSSTYLGVVESAHDPLTVDCLRHYGGSMEESLALLPELLLSHSGEAVLLSDAQLVLYQSLMRLFHSKYLLFHLFVAIHSQLRTMTDFVKELCSQDAAAAAAAPMTGGAEKNLSLVNALMVSPKCQSLLLKAFLIIPTGQVPLLWEAFATCVSSDVSTGADTGTAGAVLGVVSSSVLQCFVRSIERTVRSSSQLYSLHGVSMEAANEDPLLGAMVRLLFVHSHSLTSHTAAAAAAAASGGDDSVHASNNVAAVAGAQCVRAVLGSLSALVGFVTNYFSSAVSQLLLPVSLSDSVSVSFHELALNQVFDGIVELQRSRSALTVCEQLNALLSLVLLQSNVSAKAVNHRAVATDAASVQKQMTRLVAPFVELLSGVTSAADSMRILLLLLNNIHIWLQFTQGTDAAIQSQILVPLFADLMTAFMVKTETSLLSDRKSCSRSSPCAHDDAVISAILRILQTASVVDSSFLQSTLQLALDKVWAEIETKEPTKSSAAATATRFHKECLWVLTASAVLPSSNVVGIVPRFYSYLLKALVYPPGSNDTAPLADASLKVVVHSLLHYLRSDASSSITNVEDISEGDRPSQQATGIKAVAHMVSAEVVMAEAPVASTKSKSKKTTTAATAASAGISELNGSLVASLKLLKPLTSLDSRSSVLGDVTVLANVIMDRWVCHLEQSAAPGLDFLLKQVSELVENREVISSIRQAMLHSVVSRLMALSKETENQAASDASVLFAEALIKKLSSSTISRSSAVSDCECFCLADALMLHRSLTSADDASLSESSLLTLKGRHFDGDSPSSSAESAEGWLYLCAVLARQWIHSTSAVTVKQLPGDSRTLVRVDLNKVSEMCAAIRGGIEQQIRHQTTSAAADTQAREVNASKFASWCVSELLLGLVQTVSVAGVCDCDAVEVFTAVHKAVVEPFIAAASVSESLGQCVRRRLCAQYAAAVSKDLLFALLELLETSEGAAASQKDKLNAVAEQSLRTTKLTLERLLAVQPIVSSGYAEAEVLLSLLQHIQDISHYLDQAEGATSTKNKKQVTKPLKQKQQQQHQQQDDDAETDDDQEAMEEEDEGESDSDDAEEAAAAVRLQLWSQGLTHMMSTLTHKLSFSPLSRVGKSVAAAALDTTAAVQHSLSRSLAVVDVSKQILTCMEGIVTHSSLTHLSSSLGSFIQLLCRLIVMLIQIDNSLSQEGNSTSVYNSLRSFAQGVELIQEHLVQCYNLVAKTLSNVAASRDLQKDGTLVAAVVVDQLTKLRLSKSVRDNLFPGLYALFEKCDLKLKQQMFRQLDVQARALMTDIHDEYMRSFKFIGK